MAGFKNKSVRTGFNRPQAVAGQDVTREWREVTAAEIEVGDIIAGMGLVSAVYVTCNDDIYIEAGEGKDDFFSPDIKFLAFVRKDS